jgi:acyl-CoA synthetase (AMP-forming)/AMP-acid ligase II
VSIVMPNGIDWVAAWWAAVRVGALTLPFSTFFRPRELGWALRQGDVDTLLMHAQYLNNDYVERLEQAIPGLAAQASPELRLPSHPYLRRIAVWGRAELPRWALRGPDALLQAAAAEPRLDRDYLASREAQITPADLLIGICTSGSTAEPKIVIHTHGSALRESHQLRRVIAVREKDRSYTGMPFFWLGGLNFNLLQMMFEGSCLVFSPTPKADDVLDTLVRHRVTRITAWPPQLAALLERARVRNVDLSFVERGMFPPKDAEGRYIQVGRYVSGQLGMTESFGPHGMEAPGNLLPEARWGSVGHTVEGIERRVVNPESGEMSGEILPPGEVGELQIRGWSMMDGYYKRERSEVFLPDGWFATGDRVVIDDAGYTYFRGRVSEMIKTSGANVSPAEIEILLQSYENVQEAIVFGLPDEAKGERVAAVVVAKEGKSVDLGVLQAKLRDDLSAYKVPSELHLMPFEEIPRTDAGKVRKNLLKERFLRPS